MVVNQPFPCRVNAPQGPVRPPSCPPWSSLVVRQGSPDPTRCKRRNVDKRGNEANTCGVRAFAWPDLGFAGK